MDLCGDDSLDGQTAQTLQNLISKHALSGGEEIQGRRTHPH
jgi:hypothetical protein